MLNGSGEITQRPTRSANTARRRADSGTHPIDVAARSRMNVPFRLAEEKLDDAFLKESEAAGLMALKGHRSVGGMRASIYNAMPMAGVDALIDFMRDFARRNG